MLRSVLEEILKLSGWRALLVVFALPALEASAFVGFVIPGETAIILGGVLARQGRVNLAAVLVAAMAGAIIGDSVGYELGRSFGDRLLRHVPDRLLDEEKLQRSKDLVNRLGGKAVFVGRFTAAARVLVPGIAGTARLPYGRFLFFNALGGVIWASLFGVLGYAVGSQYQRVENNANRVGYVVLGAIVLGGVVLYVRHRRRSHGARSGPGRPDGSGQDGSGQDSSDSPALTRQGDETAG